MPTTPPHIEYRVGDFVEIAAEYAGEAALVHLDPPWAAPARYAGRGVTYETWPVTPDALDDFPDSELERDEINTDRYISELIDAAMDCLQDGGWLLLDGDSYAAPRFEAYLRDNYGEVRINDQNGRPYQGGGLRKRGRVCYHAKDGTPDGSTTGKYGKESGYPIVFAHRGETDRTLPKAVWQPARHPRWTEPTDEYDQGTVKPISPYRTWMDELVEPGELVIAGCAGSAPVLLAAEQLWGDEANAIGVDINESARTAYRTRREAVLSLETEETAGSVTTLGEFNV